MQISLFLALVALPERVATGHRTNTKISYFHIALESQFGAAVKGTGLEAERP